jgi:hypothetical protein
MPAETCRACGAHVTGKFCSECGTPAAPAQCASCGAELSAGARFCHRCGTAAPGAARASGAGAPGIAAAATTGVSLGRQDRMPWIAAGLVILVALGAIVWNVLRNEPEPAGGGASQAPPPGLAGPGLSGPAPDISQMTPRERFDRLFNRVMTAAEQGDSATVVNFTPMALGAYAQLDTVNVDARYHAAVLNAQVGDFAAARALADTILAEVPGHLFGWVIRGEVARLENDPATLAEARRGFLAAYDAEMAANRVEYLEHRPVLDRFRAEAATP